MLSSNEFLSSAIVTLAVLSPSQCTFLSQSATALFSPCRLTAACSSWWAASWSSGSPQCWCTRESSSYCQHSLGYTRMCFPQRKFHFGLCVCHICTVYCYRSDLTGPAPHQPHPPSNSSFALQMPSLLPQGHIHFSLGRAELVMTPLPSLNITYTVYTLHVSRFCV